jgi:hypothetical protein
MRAAVLFRAWCAAGRLVRGRPPTTQAARSGPVLASGNPLAVRVTALRACRPGPGPVLDHEFGARVTRVDLGGLDDGALSELVLARFGGRWSPGVLRQVVALAAGSPYAALELARETMARGGHDSAAVHLPSTLAGSLRARLDRLGPATLAVVQAAALADAGAAARGGGRPGGRAGG